MNYNPSLSRIKIKVAITDDHVLFARSLSSMINTFPDFEVIIEAFNGQDLLHRLEKATEHPDILMLDINMPVMDGRKAAQQVAAKYPAIKIVALTMLEDDNDIIRMIKAGCCSYLLKGIYPEELEKALKEIYYKGTYYADAYNINNRRLIAVENEQRGIDLNPNELRFLQLACSENSYREIGIQMNYSLRTIDGFREKVFAKLNVNSRLRMILEGIRLGLIDSSEMV